MVGKQKYVQQNQNSVFSEGQEKKSMISRAQLHP